MVLRMLTVVPGISFARSQEDTLLIQRIFSYQERFTPDIVNQSFNIYTKFHYNVNQRNFGLWLIPSMHTIAKGDRDLLIETYNKVTFSDNDHYESRRQVVWGTVPRHRSVMPTLRQLLVPKLYAPSVYAENIISPFHRSNRHFYKYRIFKFSKDISFVAFRPRLGSHTQLVKGNAYVYNKTGKIFRCVINGEFDMIRFRTNLVYDDKGDDLTLPLQSKTEAEFKFLGNDITATFEAHYYCPTTLPDSIDNVQDRLAIDTLRPTPLSLDEAEVYKRWDDAHQPDTTAVEPADSTKNEVAQKNNKAIRDFFVDVIGDNLVTSIRAKSEKAYFRLSPILNPQYLSYSHRNGVAYKMKLNVDYHFNAHRYFELRSQVGYNFKQRRFYFTAPLRFNYNPKRNGYVEVIVGNGNRISNSSVSDEIIAEHGDSIDIGSYQLDYFDDNHLRVSNNIMLFDWIDIETGLVYHYRKAVNQTMMRELNKPEVYRSFAPSMTVKLRPWKNGPVFTLNYERGIGGVYKSDITYERWETDAVAKMKLPRLRTFNIRIGGGIYSRKEDNYFVDFANFRDNNLPEGWDDDWTGHFQLLDSHLYNESKSYFRSNFSYDTPIMLSPLIPFFGKGIERERIYLSSLFTPHTRHYAEIGYGFTNRYLSMAAFASFMNVKMKEMGVKFTVELFHRW